MKICVLGDTHFGSSNASEIFRNSATKFFDFMFDYMRKNNIVHLLQEGDLYDRRRDVHFSTIKWTKEYFYPKIQEQNIAFYTVCGNHDSLYKNTNEVNSVSLLCPDTSTVVDLHPTTIIFDNVSIDFFPWINPTNLTECLQFIESSNSEYALGHFEFKGFPMYPGSIAESGFDHTLFGKYQKVFSGHYHTVSQLDNILYTGTPYELNWSDCDDLKGFWVLDTSTGVLEHIKNPYTLFERIQYNDTKDYDFSSVKDKFVKIIVSKKSSQQDFDRFVQNLQDNKPVDIKIVDLDITSDVQQSVKLTDLVSTHSMLGQVVDNLDTILDRTRLKNSIFEVYNEAMKLSNSV